MATWEPKLPSFHDTSSLWSLKSAAADHSISWSPLGSTTSGSSPPPPAPAMASSKSSPSPPLPPSRQFGKLDQSGDGEAAGTATGLFTTSNSRGNAAKSSSLLGAPGSLGTGSTKVAKKRARASRKPPTTVLEADSSNFRAMVQQLTGIPSVPFLSSSLQQRNGGGLDCLDVGMRPPTATRSLLGFGPQSLQGLPPLDPSALLPAFSSRDQAAGFGSAPPPPSPSPYFKYTLIGSSRTPQSTPNPSMGDFLRTPLDELGLDHQAQHDHHQQHQQQSQQQHMDLPRKMESLPMPLIWEGTGPGDGSSDPRGELQFDEPETKFKVPGSSGTPDDRHGDGGDGGDDQDGSSSRMVHIVDSWLSGHADQATTDKH